MIIQEFRHFKGQHCETTATGSLLTQIGIELSEPMLFGIGEGLGFIFNDPNCFNKLIRAWFTDKQIQLERLKVIS